ncbi:MAG TPA: HAMP domain-containing sensor histidine kinase, partial [Candidatus Hydrogenedentes bacterium]|nr:HAMP domain-containing sensor histidine kinase [Candidatus Hydrogenedentota bacterium]
SVDVYTGNDKVVFAVTDSGTTPEPAIRHKIFQPLFTTKTAGRGIGLGLSISKRLVESHKGRCVLDETHPNTRFLVELPLKQAAGEPAGSVS